MNATTTTDIEARTFVPKMVLDSADFRAALRVVKCHGRELSLAGGTATGICREGIEGMESIHLSFEAKGRSYFVTGETYETVARELWSVVC